MFNIVIPLFAGCLIYYLSTSFNQIIVNYLPDGLWAYSFTYSLILIWDKRINLINLALIFFTEIIIEVLQYYHLLEGVCDLFDILVYVIFSLIAITPFIYKKFFNNVRCLKKN